MPRSTQGFFGRDETDTSAQTSESPPEPLSGVEESFGLGQLGPSVELNPGTDLGGVTIVRLIAEGGMGRVYEGLQHAPSRTVAVKVMRDGLGSTALVRRFEFEAEVLARLRHPQIAQIHTFGTFEGAAGPVPFFVMEYVAEAVPVTAFATARQLDARGRVALFRRVCVAMAHAHEKGVVHRDLKPGNVLVDQDGELKVIDFGVALSTAAGLGSRTMATGAGDLVGTLRYMSPEQLGIDDAVVDARTDVYALGLMLFELLTGELPYELRGRSPVEAACLLASRSDAPLRDWARRFRGAGIGAADAAQLAVIVGTCLEPRAEDRYRGAGHLEADLGRWLAGEAILARPPTLVASLRRLARKHRAAALAAAGVFAALLVAVAGVSWFSVSAELQRREAILARQAADERAIEARGQLSRATLMLASEARDRGNIAEARRRLGQVRELGDAAGSGHPIEVDCLSASLDDAIAVLEAGTPAARAVAWSPRGERLAVASADHAIRLWTRHDVAAPWATAAAVTLTGHTGPVWALAFAPDGDSLASAAADGSVRIWDVASGVERQRLTDHGGAVYGVQFSRDGSLLVSASEDRTVRLHDTSTWSERKVLRGHDGTVFTACLTADGMSVASGSRDCTARLWRVEEGSVAKVFAGHTGGVLDVAISADGALVATGSDDATARVWDRATGRELAVLRHPTRVNAVAFIGVDRVATASADGLVRCWDARAGSEADVYRGHEAAVWSLETAGAGPLAASCAGDGTVRLWDLGRDAAALVRGPERMLTVAISAAGTCLAVGDSAATVRVLDATTLLERGRLSAGTGRVGSVAFSPDGALIAAACEDGAIRTWRTASLEAEEPIRLHERRAYAVAFAPDGERMITASEDRTARIVDRTANEEPLVLKHPGRVFCGAFAPHGEVVATACEDRCGRLWNATTGEMLALLGGHDGPVNWVAFSADGTSVATASSDGSVRTWDTQHGTARAVMRGPARQVWKVAFTPDGTRLAAAAADGTVQLWDAASGAPLCMLRGHRDQIWGLAFAPAGDAIATASWDGTARLWGVSTAEIAARRARAARGP